MLSSYDKRYLANIVIEAKVPLKVGSSDLDMLQDSPVQKDFNELPMILGTSIAGVLRKEFDNNFANDIFGDEHSKKNDNKGSRLVISNALLCDEKMLVNETLLLEKSDFLKIYDNLPIREHTAITDKGVANENHKFDEELIYKGSRFRFRVELIGDENDKEKFQTILKTINSQLFRLGGGTTKGFGNVEVLNEESTYSIYDLNSDEYRSKSSSLNTKYDKQFPSEKIEATSYNEYILKIAPDDFFMFGSGFGDDEVNMTPVYEQVIDYENGGLSEKQVLIPASSIKGAIAHRSTYNYNLLTQRYIGSDADKQLLTSLVKIFGEAKDSKNNVDGFKGKLLISDCFTKEPKETRIFDHVSIDRFTGGGIDGHLFKEKTLSGGEYAIEILLHKDISGEELEAFENTLFDITTGMLALGGATMKGHGVFNGMILKNGENYEKN